MRITTVFTISTIVLTITAQTKPIQSDDISPETQSIKEDASQILFGERGILTGIFRMMDQQRKVQTQPQHDTAAADNGKIGNFDFKKIVDTLVSGSASKGELGDHATELPEVLGICNRLSCGDIYKAIDKFRKSEMFSNFQTALTLVNDPNGWETIGKLLSNPELIAQFTAGSGMEELFGSALGTAEKESKLNKNKNSKIMPEDGDFGIDFSEDGEGENITKTIDPKIDFSVDKKGGSEDYYSEIANVGDESEEEITVDQTLPPSTKITKSTSETTDFNEKLPPVSFSIDGGGEENENEETETVMTAELPPKPPRVLKRIHAGGPTDTKDGVQPGSVTRMIWLTTTSPATTYSTTPFFRPTQTTRPVMTTTWRTRITTTTKPTTTTTMRNYRKDNDYYAMYYDDADKG
uniref:MI domain-containing protein n=2 Tax=Caenorhabditis tropicalis TaxID=1561998 RepID=A0A1I7TC66_9PELO